MGLETDSNGLVTQYGPRKTTDGIGGVQSTKGDTIILMYDFTYDNLPAVAALESAEGVAKSGGNSMVAVIPANALIRRATIEVLTAFAGGTSYTVGLVSAVDGSTSISSNGIFTATQLALANLTPAGTIILSTGALIGAQANIAGADAEVKVTASGTFTAGRARLMLEYQMPSLGNN